MPATYEPIATTTIGTATNTVTFSTIPATYTDLLLVMTIKGTGNGYPYIRVNGDSGTNYSVTELRGNGTAASSTRASNQTSIQPVGVTIFTSAFGFQNSTHFMNYSNTTTNKTMISRSDNANNGSDAVVNLWRNTAAISSIVITASANNFDTGSIFTLYGIKSA